MIFDSVTSTLIKGPDKLPMLGTYSQFGGGSLPLSLNIFCTLDDNRIFFLGTSEAGGAGIYDLNQGSFAPLADRDGRIHGLGVVQPLNDGRVLVAGGWNDIHDPSNPAAAIEIFDPATARYIQLPKHPKEEGKQRSLRNFFFPVTP
jgi:hypothetical protein